MLDVRRKIEGATCRNYKNYSSRNSLSDLHDTSWDKADTCLTVDDAWTSFEKNFITIADRHAPMCSKRVRSNTLPWINDHIRGLIMQRNFHHKKAQKSGSSNEWNIYRSLRNEVSTCIRKAKETYYSNLIVDNKSNSRKLWSVIKSAIGTKVKSTQIQSLEVDGSDTSCPKTISTSFASFFKTIVSNVRQTLPDVDVLPVLSSQPRTDIQFKYQRCLCASS